MDKLEGTEEDNEKRASKLASDLRRRSVRLRRYAAWILAIIVAVLLNGIAIFVGAGALANRDTSSAIETQRINTLNSLKESLKFIETSLVEARQEANNAQKKYSMELSGKGGSGKYGIGPIAKELRTQQEEAMRREDNYERELRDINNQIRQISMPAVSKPLPPETQLASVISAISTRVGAVVLLLFLVQILVPLYRYNIRLSSHYESCADTLELLLIGEMAVPMDLFVRLASSLSPSAVDFGSAPKAPTEQALRLLGDILARK